MGKHCPILFILILIVVSACSSGGLEDSSEGPLLLRDVTLPPNTPGQTQEVLLVGSTPFALTPEIISPLDEVTVPANFVLVTPTLPPSKTASATPSLTTEPPPSQTPTVTVTSTATQLVLPTSVIIPVTGIAALPIDEICDSTWFFLRPRPDACPRNSPLADQGVYQKFENGHMVWVRRTDAIYVMYRDSSDPRWEVYRDFFSDGMIETVDTDRPEDLWEPRRGFGLLWRTSSRVRSRIGWAVQQDETPYSVNLQIANDGGIFFNDPDGNIFGLTADRTSWALYGSG